MQSLVARSVEEFSPAEWERLYAGELEGWHYYRAIEQAGLAGFEWRYFAVREGGRVRALVPAFITDYRLDTTLTGALRRITRVLTRLFPRLLVQRLLSLGSPIAEVCNIGFDPDCSAEEQALLLDIIMREVETHARSTRISMLAAKDAPAAHDALWAVTAAAHGLRRQPSLPTALLDLRFASLEEYLATLSRATRKDLRRKLKACATLRVEWRSNIDDVIDDVMRLYRATLAHAQFTFEELTPAFFTGVLRELGPRASCATYWLGDRLVAFNLVLHDGSTLLDKFLGMDYSVARRYNLYYFTWLQNVRYAIEHGLVVYQSGQGLHREKLRLGSRFSANWLWYRHRNLVLDVVFATFERLFRLDRHDPELAALLPALPDPPKKRAGGVRGSTWVAWASMIALAGLSQISLKYAGLDSGAFNFSVAAFERALASPWLWISIGSHVGEFMVWIAILRKSTLSAAFPTLAILFVMMIVAGWLLFGETIGWSKLAGSLLILGGILLLGPDTDDDIAQPEPARMP